MYGAIDKWSDGSVVHVSTSTWRHLASGKRTGASRSSTGWCRDDCQWELCRVRSNVPRRAQSWCRCHHGQPYLPHQL